MKILNLFKSSLVTLVFLFPLTAYAEEVDVITESSSSVAPKSLEEFLREDQNIASIELDSSNLAKGFCKVGHVKGVQILNTFKISRALELEGTSLIVFIHNIEKTEEMIPLKLAELKKTRNCFDEAQETLASL